MQQSFKTIAILLPVFFAGSLFTNCSAILGGSDDNSDEDALNVALLGALGINATATCSLGGTAFTASGTACGTGVAAGTGTLTAASLKTDFVSVQISYQLLDSSSSLSLVGGINPSAGVVSSGSSPELNVTPTVAKLPADTGTGITGPGVAAATWCVELHLGESPPHVIADNTSCTPKATSSVAYENDANSPSAQGGLWGFVLNNASITSLTVNTSENFSD